MSMTVRILGTVGHLVRNCTANRSGLLRCCSVNYDKFCSLETKDCHKSPVTQSRNFSLDSLVLFPRKIFRCIAESDICAYTRDVYTFVHDATGLPWWATIFLSGAALRVISLPLRSYQIVLLDRLQKIRNMDEIAKKVLPIIVKKQKANMWTPEKAKSAFKSQMRRERQYLIEKYNCHPFKIVLLGYLDLPVWLDMSITWRTMSYGFSDDIAASNVLTLQMMAEGPFWCVDLTLPDPYYILPVLVFVIQMIQIEVAVIQSNLLKREKTLIFKIVTNVSRLFSVIAALFCSYFPAAVSLFWVSTSSMNLVRDFILMSPKVRQVLKLPYEPITSRHVIAAFTERLQQLLTLKGKKSKGVIQNK